MVDGQTSKQTDRQTGWCGVSSRVVRVFSSPEVKNPQSTVTLVPVPDVHCSPDHWAGQLTGEKGD